MKVAHIKHTMVRTPWMGKAGILLAIALLSAALSTQANNGSFEQIHKQNKQAHKEWVRNQKNRLRHGDYQERSKVHKIKRLRKKRLSEKMPSNVRSTPRIRTRRGVVQF